MSLLSCPLYLHPHFSLIPAILSFMPLPHTAVITLLIVFDIFLFFMVCHSSCGHTDDAFVHASWHDIILRHDTTGIVCPYCFFFGLFCSWAPLLTQHPSHEAFSPSPHGSRICIDHISVRFKKYWSSKGQQASSLCFRTHYLELQICE